MKEQQTSFRRAVNWGRLSLVLGAIVLVFRINIASWISSWLYGRFYQDINCTSFGSCSFSAYDTIIKIMGAFINWVPVLVLIFGIVSLFTQTGRNRIYGGLGVVISVGLIILLWLAVTAVGRL